MVRVVDTGPSCAAWNIACSNRLPEEVSTTRGMSDIDAVFSQAPYIYLEFPLLFFLSGCDAKPQCDSFEARKAVLQTVSDDHNNALIKYAAKNSTTPISSDASAETEKSKQQPLYLLGEQIDTMSTSADKRTLKCRGSLSVTIGDTKVSKEVDFTVQQSPAGNVSVSVAPFQF
jgi:hypothetical protein